MDCEALTAWLRLQGARGVGNIRAATLLEAFGSPAAIFGSTVAQLSGHVPLAVATALLQTPAIDPALLDRCLAWLNQDPKTHCIWGLTDADYPPALRAIPDPPTLLFAKTPRHASTDHPASLLGSGASACLAIVGSRNPTPQGLANAEQIACALTQAGLTIVSGLALGIDGGAHRGALRASEVTHLPTIAVVGTGLDRVYPAAHRDLAHQICENGALLSEYPPGTPPLANHFPQRNRLISGLALGTVVMEATLKSGSLITAQLALEEGKDVFAVPGSIHSPQSKGCHALLRQGAKLTECAQDVLEELQWTAGTAARDPLAEPEPGLHSGSALAPHDAAILAAVGFDLVDLDTVAERTQIPVADLQAALMTLELQGDIGRAAGARYQRLIKT